VPPLRDELFLGTPCNRSGYQDRHRYGDQGDQRQRGGDDEHQNQHALVAVPMSILVTRSDCTAFPETVHRAVAATGALNGQIEGGFPPATSWSRVRRQREVERIQRENEEMFVASFGAQFVSGIIMRR